MAERNYNIALNASDNFSGAFNRLLGQVNTIEGASSRLRSSLGGLSTAFGALGGAISVGGLAVLARDAVEAAARLDDLAERTGASVESLSRFAGVARITGQDMGLVEQSMGKLSKAIVEAQDGSSNAARAFTAFGVTIKNADGSLKNAGDLMAEIAGAQDKFSDGAGKAAAMSELLGRSGEQLIPFLKDYVTYGGEVGEITADQASDAERLQIELGKLQLQMERLLQGAILPLVGGLRDVVTEFRDLVGAVSGAAGSVNFGFLDALKDTVRRTGAELAYLQQVWENAKLWASGRGEQRVAPGAAYDAYLVAAQNRELARSASELAPLMEATATAAEKTGVAFTKSGDGAKKAADQFKAFKAAIMAVHDNALAAAEAEQKLLDIQEQWGKDSAKYAKEMAEAQEKDALAREDSILAIFEQVDALEREVEQLGLSNAAREKSELLLKLETSGLDKNSEAYRELADRIGAATTAKEAFARNQEIREEWQRTADMIQSSLTDALLRGFESGKDFAKNLRDTLWNMFRTLVLRPTISAIMAPIAGGLGGVLPGAANAGSLLGGGGSMGGGFDISSLFGGSSLLGYGGVSGLFSGAGGIFGAGAIGNSFALSSAGQALGLSAAGLDAAGGVALTGLGTTLGAALPILGIALAAYMMFKKPRGGPKTGGYAQSGLPDIERFFTPNQKDPDLQQLVSAQQNAYDTILRALGGTGTAGFAFGYDTDPEGTASDRIRAGVSVNGQLLYDTGNIETGRDNAATQAALELEAKRALLAALQASDLPQDIAGLLNSVTAATADAKAVDEILGVAQALGSIYELFNSDVLSDGLAAFNDSMMGFNTAIESAVGSVRDLIAEYDGTAESATALAQATSGVYTAAVQAVAQMEAMRRAIGGMFENAATEYRLAGMDQAGQRDYLQQQIARDTELLRASTDANEIQRLANLINQNQGRLWGTLTDDERRASAESFAQAAESAAAIADAQITRATDAMRTLIEDMLTDVRAVFVEAGTKQDVAAEKQLAAANTPITINLRGVPSEVGP